MALPWEEYQQAQGAVAAPRAVAPAAVEPGPWDDYAQITTLPTVQAAPPDFSGVTSGVDSTASGRMADGWMAGPLRDTAFSARSALQGAGSVLGAVGGDAFNNYIVNPIARAVGAQEVRPYREELGALADILGLPKAQTARERIYGDIGEALTGAGLTMGAGAVLGAGRAVAPTLARAAAAPQAVPTLGARAAEVLAAQPGLQVASTIGGAGASAAARESGAGTGGQLAAALAGGLAPSAITAGVPMALRGAIRGGEANRQNLSQAIDDFAVLGATPSVGQGTGAWSRQGAETLLGAGPTSAGVMARFADRQAEAIGAGLQQQADTIFRNPSAERAGRAIEQGIRGEGGFIRTSRERANQLYGRLDELLPQDERVGIDNVRAALASLNEEIPGAPSVSRFFQNARLEGIESALAKDAGGVEGVLSRPGMREQVDQMRSDLTQQAAVRRAELAAERNEQGQALTSAAGDRRAQLQAEADQLRNRLGDMVEQRRVAMYQEADEQMAALFAEQHRATVENQRRQMLGMNNLEPVLTDAEIQARVPSRAQIDSRLPRPEDIDAQVPSAADLDAQVMPAAAIESRLTPDSSITDANFGADYVDKQINEYLTSQIDGKLPYEALRKLRTLVGSELENTSLVSDVPRSKWKAVYAALSQDMEAAATTPEAKQALDRANRYFNARATRIDDIDRVIDRNGGPERIYQAVMGGVKDGGSTLRAVMQSLPEEGQKAVTAAALRRMGLANPGAQDAAGEAFSAATFLTNWNKTSPEARRALFDRYGPGFTSDLDKIAKVAERIKEGGQAIANPSGTARQGAQFAYWGGLGGALMTGQVGAALGLGLGGVGSNVGARLMTNPNWVRWMAKATDLPVGSLPAQINVLKRLGSERGDAEITQAAQLLAENSEQ